MANHDCYPALSTLQLKIVTAGTAMYQPSLVEDRPDLLLGRPIIYTEYAKSIGTQGDLILANWNEYLEGTLQPLATEESIHVRFVNHEQTFKFYLRNAGIPWWKVALTPAYSSNKLSPFVVLDTRA
jgi:HK97 family phage major capsid protein